MSVVADAPGRTASSDSVRSVGARLVAPLLFRHGTSARHQCFLRRIVSGDDVWCIGFSEPEAGSDLAAVATTAVAVGDGYRVDGNKAWVSGAEDANRMLCLVRNDTSGRPRDGWLSLLIVDMAAPGVTVRPVRSIAGDNPFCDVRLAGVRVPAENRLGPAGAGWALAGEVLRAERLSRGAGDGPAEALAALKRLAEKLGAFDDPAFGDRYTRLRLDVRDLGAAFDRDDDAAEAHASFLALVSGEICQRIAELAIETAADHGARLGDFLVGNEGFDVMARFLESRAATVAGGTAEMQREIIARRLLDLPNS